MRDRLGLSRTALERAAYAHLDGAPHLRRFVTKALAMHLADSVWTATERHLFRDARGGRHGMPRVGRWFDFTRLPGRARSHTRPNKWETFRLHGTLAGQRAAYTNTDGSFMQPRHLRAVTSDAWWSYAGPLAVVFTGLPGGTLVLPVRLPTAPGNQPILEHHLADPSRWHKVDLVRRRDPNAEGGWRYEAHLMVLTTPYVSPSTAARRATAAMATMDRVAGVDVNVSNITVASHAGGTDVRITRIERDAPAKQRARRRARAERRRQRALDRSRRAMNRAQYQLSKRQAKHARRRDERGLPPVDTIPMGPRVTNAARTANPELPQGPPFGELPARSRGAGRGCGRVVAGPARSCASGGGRHRRRARHAPGRRGCPISTWSRRWGAAVAAFSPGTLVAAIDREARAVAAIAGARGGLDRAATRPTALSQHCPCGTRVAKRLGDRVHACGVCGLRGDRDAVAAVLASFVVVDPLGHSASARVDYAATASALPAIRAALSVSSFSGWQDTLSESTDLSAREGSSLTWSTSTPDTASRIVAVARRTVGWAPCPTLDETGVRRTTPERARVRANLSLIYDLASYLRDSS